MATLDADDLIAIAALIAADPSIAAIKAITDTLAAASVTVTSPVAASGDITIYQGDDYITAEGRNLSFAVADAGHLFGLDDPAAEVRLKMDQATWAGVATSTAGGYTVVFQPDATETGALTACQRYELEATTVAGSTVTLATGTVALTRDIPAVAAPA